MKIVIFGPFIGEFGWELCYWHGWLRKFSNEFKNSKIIASSYAKSYPLYHDFVHEFVPLSKKLEEKKYSCAGYFPDFSIMNNQEKNEFLGLYNQEIKFLMDRYNKNENEVIHIPIYPQRNRKHLSHLFFLFKKIFFINNETIIQKQNPFKGILIKNYINFIVSEHKDSWDVQTPPKNFQYIPTLRSSSKVDKFTDVLIKQINNEDFVTIFPRKRNLRRPDKNWSEQNWIEFIKLIIDKLNLGVFICGTPEGTCLHDFKYKNLINTVFEDPDILLDLQIALLNKSSYSIHGRSGSCYLSMQANIKTFMPGPEAHRHRICVYDNITDAEIFYYTKYGVNPSPQDMFNKFKYYFLQNKN